MQARCAQTKPLIYVTIPTLHHPNNSRSPPQSPLPPSQPPDAADSNVLKIDAAMCKIKVTRRFCQAQQRRPSVREREMEGERGRREERKRKVDRLEIDQVDQREKIGKEVRMRMITRQRGEENERQIDWRRKREERQTDLHKDMQIDRQIRGKKGKKENDMNTLIGRKKDGQIDRDIQKERGRLVERHTGKQSAIPETTQPHHPSFHTTPSHTRTTIHLPPYTSPSAPQPALTQPDAPRTQWQGKGGEEVELKAREKRG